MYTSSFRFRSGFLLEFEPFEVVSEPFSSPVGLRLLVTPLQTPSRPVASSCSFLLLFLFFLRYSERCFFFFFSVFLLRSPSPVMLTRFTVGEFSRFPCSLNSPFPGRKASLIYCFKEEVSAWPFNLNQVFLECSSLPSRCYFGEDHPSPTYF